MRDNGSNAGSGSSNRITSHIRPVHWSRTEHQLKPHEGFAPQAIEPREPLSLVAGEGYTMRLAEPPKWAQRDDLPCIARVPKGNQPDLYDTTDPRRARALCAGCPVKQACLDDAMADEAGLGPRSRWLVRGGLTPQDRAALEAARSDQFA